METARPLHVREDPYDVRPLTRDTDADVVVRSRQERLIGLRLFEWEEEAQIGPRLRERIARSALRDVNPSDVRLRSVAHGSEPVGRGVTLDMNDPAGPYLECRVSRTTRGDDLLAMVEDGLIGGASIEFYDAEPPTNDGDLIVRNAIDLRGVAVVEQPAYAGARVLAVRDVDADGDASDGDGDGDASSSSGDGNPRQTELQSRMLDQLERLEERMRRYETRPAGGTHTRRTPNREQVRDLFAGLVVREHLKDSSLYERALADITGTTGGSGDASGLMPASWWMGDLLAEVDSARPVWGLIGNLPFPTTGTQVTVPTITQHTAVGDRSAQKAEPNTQGMIVTATPYTAQWFDGAVDVALELIEQAAADPSMLELVWADLLGQYAIHSEAHAVGIIDAAATPDDGGAENFSDTKALRQRIAEANLAVKAATNAPASFLLVPEASWGTFIAMETSGGVPAIPAVGPSNAQGQTTATALRVDFDGLTAVPADVTAPVIGNGRAVVGGERGPSRVQTTNVADMGVDIGILGPGLVVARIAAGLVSFEAAA